MIIFCKQSIQDEMPHNAASQLAMLQLLAEIKIRKVATIKNRYNQALHLSQDTTWESDKNTIKHHKR